MSVTLLFRHLQLLWRSISLVRTFGFLSTYWCSWNTSWVMKTMSLVWSMGYHLRVLLLQNNSGWMLPSCAMGEQMFPSFWIFIYWGWRTKFQNLEVSQSWCVWGDRWLFVLCCFASLSPPPCKICPLCTFPWFSRTREQSHANGGEMIV